MKIGIWKCLLFVALLFVAGCDEVAEGVVINKKHDAAYYYTTIIPMGKSFMPIINRFPDSWRIFIQGKNQHGEMVVVAASVEKETYDVVRIGDIWRSGKFLRAEE